MNQEQNWTRDRLLQRVAVLIQIVENLQAPFPLKPIIGDWLVPSSGGVESTEAARRFHEEQEIEALRGQVITFLEECDRYLNDYGTKEDWKRFRGNALVRINQAERGTYQKKSFLADLSSLKLLLELAGTRQNSLTRKVPANEVCISISPAPEDRSPSREGETDTSADQKVVGSAPSDPEDLLQGKAAVNYQIAAQYLGLTDRQIRNLVRKKNLNSVGGGQQKRITTASLRRRKGELPLK
jgi:hypothetical protein